MLVKVLLEKEEQTHKNKVLQAKCPEKKLSYSAGRLFLNNKKK